MVPDLRIYTKCEAGYCTLKTVFVSPSKKRKRGQAIDREKDLIQDLIIHAKCNDICGRNIHLEMSAESSISVFERPIWNKSISRSVERGKPIWIVEVLSYVEKDVLAHSLDAAGAVESLAGIVVFETESEVF